MKPLFVIPHEKVREDVEEVIGEDSCILFITTPGQVFLHLLLFRLSCIFYAAPAKSLHEEKPIMFSMFSSLHQLAALIDDSAGVIATNTAAIQLATARNKPRLVL